MVLINQIYHTSHCGSTLLAHLISYSTKTHIEPQWCYSFMCNYIDRPIDMNFSKEILSIYNSNECIKFPNQLCNISNSIGGRKIFVYRSLKDHLHYMYHNPRVYLIYPGVQRDYTLNNIHEKLKPLLEYCDNDFKKLTLFWADNVVNMLESDNVLFINSTELFLDNPKIVKRSLDHFNLEQKYTDYTPRYSKSFVHENVDVSVPKNYGLYDDRNIPKNVEKTIDWWNNISSNMLIDFI